MKQNVISSSTCKKFDEIHNKLELPTNGYKTKRFSTFLSKLSFLYSVPKNEVRHIGLITLLRIARLNKDLNNKNALEAYIWKSIRHGVIQYSKNESYKNSKLMICEAAELDCNYGLMDSKFAEFELAYDTEKIIGKLQGKSWLIANLVMIFGNNPSLLCPILNISRKRYSLILNGIKLAYENAGF